MSSEHGSILVVDDERIVTNLLSEVLTGEGYDCTTAPNGEAALKILSTDNFDAMLLDLGLPEISGMDVLKKAKLDCPETAVIIVTAAGDAHTAVEAMKNGAMDYITKPFDLERISCGIEAALKTKAILKSRLTSAAKGVKVRLQEGDWIDRLDKIALGVETRLHFLTGHVMSIAILEETINIAKSLEIPGDQIEKWADARRKDIKDVNILDHLVENIQQNSVA
ncbi:response regulator [Chloroflexota bacterium]